MKRDMERNEHIKKEMKEAVRAGEGEKAEALQHAAETPEVKGAEIDFVPASEQIKGMFGMEKCMIIHNLPEDMREQSNVIEYAQYLFREARRQSAVYYYPPEKKDFILVQFPGRPAEVYSETAFIGSLLAMHKQKQQAK